MNSLLLTALVLVGLYLLAALLLQRPMLFAGRARPAPTGQPPAEVEAQMLGAEPASEIWFLPPHPAASTRKTAPAVIFAHGNGELIDDYGAAAFEPLRAWGLAVLLVEYPGYGRSGGSPTEASVQQAMVSAYDWLVARDDIDKRRVVAMGRSLGGGAACSLATERPLAGLVLLSTFTSIRDIAPRFGLPGFLVMDPFDNVSAVTDFRGPVFVAHGKDDELIPLALAQQLAASARTEVLQLDGHHNDCPMPWPQLRQFLSDAALLP